LYFRSSAKVVFCLGGWTVGLARLMVGLNCKAWPPLVTLVGRISVGLSWPWRDSRSCEILEVRVHIRSFKSEIFFIHRLYAKHKVIQTHLQVCKQTLTSLHISDETKLHCHLHSTPLHPAGHLESFPLWLLHTHTAQRWFFSGVVIVWFALAVFGVRLGFIPFLPILWHCSSVTLINASYAATPVNSPWTLKRSSPY